MAFVPDTFFFGAILFGRLLALRMRRCLIEGFRRSARAAQHACSARIVLAPALTSDAPKGRKSLAWGVSPRWRADHVCSPSGAA